jgi:hypothetical protein
MSGKRKCMCGCGQKADKRYVRGHNDLNSHMNRSNDKPRVSRGSRPLTVYGKQANRGTTLVQHFTGDSR